LLAEHFERHYVACFIVGTFHKTIRVAGEGNHVAQQGQTAFQSRGCCLAALFINLPLGNVFYQAGNITQLYK